MNKIHISQNQFSDLINLVNGVFLPINNFVSKKEFIQIIDNQKYKNHFFPFPITFGVNKEIYSKIKKKKNI